MAHITRSSNLSSEPSLESNSERQDKVGDMDSTLSPTSMPPITVMKQKAQSFDAAGTSHAFKFKKQVKGNGESSPSPKINIIDHLDSNLSLPNARKRKSSSLSPTRPLGKRGIAR